LRKAVFLDRDGVLIRSEVVAGKPIAVQDIAGMEILPGVGEACRRLKAVGYLLVIVTNQPDVGRGKAVQNVVEAMNASLAVTLGIDAVRVCFHDGYSPCACRKPRPGMLLDAARTLGINLAESFMIGDRSGDIEAGQAAGCRTVHIAWGHGEALKAVPDFTAPDLAAAADWILTGGSIRDTCNGKA
jgi:D-glycero-D-manno-heptose 1,7-bisphosphate phosphatase